MITLAAGTYELKPSRDPAQPVVHFTVPSGWNAWEGPNRFEGIELGSRNNDEALASRKWYAGLLALEVWGVAARPCTTTDVTQVGTEALVRALTRIPDMDVISEPERTVRFGHPTTHLRLRGTGTGTGSNCGTDILFNTATNGQIGYAGKRHTYDAWVIGTSGRPIVVLAVQSEGVPETEVDALPSVVDSIELVRHE